MAVAAVLRDDHVGPERCGQLREQALDGTEPGPFPRPRLERHVHDGPGGRAGPERVHRAGPREQVLAGLMERDGHHARVVGVDRLDAIAVMDVEIDVQHAESLPPRARDRQGRVVVDAEPRCTARHRVMESAARMHGVAGSTVEDRLHRAKRSAGDHRTGLVHAGERGDVAGSDPGPEPTRRILREPLHGVEIARVVDREQLVVRGRLGRQARFGSDRPQQVDPWPEPQRAQGVAGPEVIALRARPEDEQRGVGGRHSRHDTRDGARRHDVSIAR